jgi:hypothetical protein
MCANVHKFKPRYQVAGGQSTTSARIRSTSSGAGEAGNVAEGGPKHTKLPYKEMSNVSSEDIERIIAQAKDDGVTR